MTTTYRTASLTRGQIAGLLTELRVKIELEADENAGQMDLNFGLVLRELCEAFELNSAEAHTVIGENAALEINALLASEIHEVIQPF